MKSLTAKYRLCLSNRDFLLSFATAVLFLAIGVVVSYFAIAYANERASNSVTDIILSNTRVYDLDGAFVFGPLIYWVIVILYVLSKKPQALPFMLKSVGLFLVIRSIFITLTHVGPFPVHVTLDIYKIISAFTSGSDQFFSGHTGLPFLIALVFWEDKTMRWFSLISSVFFGVVVLLAHLHYSIDVFAAFFITYAIAHMAEKFFRKDRAMFYGGIQSSV